MCCRFLSLLRFVAVAVLICFFFGLPVAHAQVTPDGTPQERAQKLTAQAVEQYNHGDYANALDTLQKSLVECETIFETHFWLGRVFATKAGSLDEAKQLAIFHFRRAVELQPYGDDGDLARQWLARYQGRSKRLVVAQALHPDLKTMLVPATKLVTLSITNSAIQAKLDVDADKVIHDQTVDLGKLTPDDLAQICRDTGGKSTTDTKDADIGGWLLGIAVEEMTGTKSKAKVWIFDPVSKQLSKPLSFSTTLGLPELFSTKTFTTGFPTLDSLSANIWARCSTIVNADSSPKILDEIQFGTEMGGIYARSSAQYEQAIKLPLILLAPATAEDEEHEDSAREVTFSLQQAILESGTTAVISSGNTRRVLQKLNVDVTSAKADDIVRVGQAIKSRYILFPKLSRFDVSVQKQALGLNTKIKARTVLALTVYDCASGKEIYTKEYDKNVTSNKMLNDGIGTLSKNRAKAIADAVKDASDDFQVLLKKP